MSESVKIGLVLLAAGASRRLGHPKQLISFKGKNLLQHVIDSSEELTTHSKVLVLGAYSEKIEREIDSKSFRVLRNESWDEGMASSLRLGVEKTLQFEPNLNAIVILVSDQPFVSKKLLKEMIELYESESSIVVCDYGESKGVPVLFGRKYFEELKDLSGDQGAKRIIKKYKDKLKTITFDQGNFDVDSPEDLNRLNNWKD